jgi:hypothetical protein
MGSRVIAVSKWGNCGIALGNWVIEQLGIE